jgi:hypothetical protein
MNSYLITGGYLVAHYLHIVCATLLVGGTLFYEMVVPVAIDELRPEQQLLVFARARWVFKWIVWLSVAILMISGIVGSYEHWDGYSSEQLKAPLGSASASRPQQVFTVKISPLESPGVWLAAHTSTAIIAMLISVSLTLGKTPPSQPVRWMRLNLVILLLVIFLATATRQTRITFEGENAPQSDVPALHTGTGG